MKYGMNSYLWTDQCTGDKFLPLFEEIGAMGFDAVEPAIFETDPAPWATLGQQLQGMGLERTAVTALLPEQNLISGDLKTRRAGREHLERAIDCCHALGSRILAGPLYAGLGVFSGKGPTATEWKYAVEVLQNVSEHAREAGVTLALEPLNRFEVYLLNSCADANRMVRDVAHPNCQLMYDTFHANIEEKDVTEAIVECAEALVHVHISENDRSTPGQGLVPWKETFAALKRINYDGFLTIEAFGQGLPALAAATKIWRRMFDDESKLAAEGLAFMKQCWEA